jgi:hypothetical protein
VADAHQNLARPFAPLGVMVLFLVHAQLADEMALLGSAEHFFSVNFSALKM